MKNIVLIIIFLFLNNNTILCRPDSELIDVYNKSHKLTHKTIPKNNYKTITEKKDIQLARYIITFEKPKSIQHNILPEFRIYYKGKIIPLHDDSYIFEADKNLTELDIIFGKLNTPKYNTIHNLTLLKNTTHTTYHLEKKSEIIDAKRKIYWDIISEKSGSDTIKITEDNLIIVMDNTLIDHLESIKWDAAGTATYLPKIIFKKNISYDTLQKSHVYSLLTALDNDQFHAKTERTINKLSKTEIIQIQNNDDINV